MKKSELTERLNANMTETHERELAFARRSLHLLRGGHPGRAHDMPQLRGRALAEMTKPPTGGSARKELSLKQILRRLLEKNTNHS